MKLYARVKVNGKWKLINPNQIFVIPCECRNCLEVKQ